MISNPNLRDDADDVLFHLALSKFGNDLPGTFGDVRVGGGAGVGRHQVVNIAVCAHWGQQ